MDFKNLDKEANTEVIDKKQSKKPQQPQNLEEQENKKVFSFTLKPSLIKKLDIVAKMRDRSRSNMLEKILEKYFKEEGIY
jgi:ATP-dependent protease Clp ATPase subunit